MKSNQLPQELRDWVTTRARDTHTSEDDVVELCVRIAMENMNSVMGCSPTAKTTPQKNAAKSNGR